MMIAIRLACILRVDDVFHAGHNSTTVILKKYVIAVEFKVGLF